MTLNKEQIAQLEEAIKPLLQFLNDNCHPHCSVIVTPDGAELVEGVASVINNDYIKD